MVPQRQSTITCREAGPEDSSRLLGVFSVVRPSIARLQSNGIYRAMTQTVGTDPRIVALLAEEPDGRPLGYVVGVTDWARFWRQFMLRHPMLAVRSLRRRWAPGRGRAATGEAPPPPGNESSGPSNSDTSVRSWSDSSPSLVKIIHIGVVPDARGRGVGSQLYRSLFAILRARGITRIDATIDAGNDTSVSLHQRTGWTIVPSSQGYFATRDLDTDDYA